MPAVEICSDKLAAGMINSAVETLKPVPHHRIVVDHVGDVVDQFDDQLGHLVARCRLASDDDRARQDLDGGIAADVGVAGDDVQQVQKLALVFVDALDHHIEQGIDGDVDAETLADGERQPLLVGPLDGDEGLAKFGIVGQRLQPFQLVEMDRPIVADMRADQFGQQGVGGQQPAAWCYPVGLVGDFARRQVLEIREDGRFHQSGMDGGDAVDAMAADEGQMGHADAALAVLADQGHSAQQFGVAGMAMADRPEVSAAAGEV